MSLAVFSVSAALLEVLRAGYLHARCIGGRCRSSRGCAFADDRRRRWRRSRAAELAPPPRRPRRERRHQPRSCPARCCFDNGRSTHMNVVLLVVDSLARLLARAARRARSAHAVPRSARFVDHAASAAPTRASAGRCPPTAACSPGCCPRSTRAHFQTMAYNEPAPTVAELLAGGGLPHRDHYPQLDLRRHDPRHHARLPHQYAADGGRRPPP